MLKIEATPSAVSVRVNRGQKAQFTLSNVKITEDDPLLTNKLVSGTLNWGDGTLPIDLSPDPVSSPLVVAQKSNVFGPGFYNIVVTARNFRAPTADTAQKIINFTVENETEADLEIGQIYGPILPRESGFPNKEQWSLSSGRDLLILESSVRMLLNTAKGERVMEPEYGTGLHAVIFELDSGAIETLIQDDIQQALARWEPRVSLSSIKVERTPNLRQAKVECMFISRLVSQPFQVNLQFER
jgi:phage baseplate assembly protein W